MPSDDPYKATLPGQTPTGGARGVGDLLAKGWVDPTQASLLAEVEAQLKVAITPTMLEAMASPDDPIGRQFLPSAKELNVGQGEDPDPIGDVRHSPIAGVVHRYPDRALLMPVHVCSVYCRFCFRREAVGGQEAALSSAKLEAALAYLEGQPSIWEVILTGGDPMVLSPRRLGDIITTLDAMPHVGVIRIHTRVPLVSPERVNDRMLAALKTNTAVFVAIHTNHANEFTPEGKAALRRLSDSGIPLLSQTVLLRGVNDTSEQLEALMRALVENRVRPYYLHHLDMAQGVGHFHVPIARGRALLRGMRGKLSGLCQPTYMLDLPGGHGKVPIGPSFIKADEARRGYQVAAPDGQVHFYDDRGEKPF